MKAVVDPNTAGSYASARSGRESGWLLASVSCAEALLFLTTSERSDDQRKGEANGHEFFGRGRCFLRAGIRRQLKQPVLGAGCCLLSSVLRFCCFGIC